MHDLAVIVVSFDQAAWLPQCLTTLHAHAEGLDVDVVVVDNGTRRESQPLVERDFPWARALVCENRGFGHANNVALATVDARHVLFLNADTEFVDGTLRGLVDELERRTDVGVAGVRQLGPDGMVSPTMRRFPNVTRALGDALGLERLPARPVWAGERELRLERYDAYFEADWTIGSFMLVRGEAVQPFDERFFLYSEEVDLCRRIRQAGWAVAHLPGVTILHHGTSVRTLDPRMARQNAYAQLQYAQKHFPPATRAAYRAALLVRYGLRSIRGDGRAAARAAASLVLHDEPGPFA